MADYVQKQAEKMRKHNEDLRQQREKQETVEKEKAESKKLEREIEKGARNDPLKGII